MSELLEVKIPLTPEQIKLFLKDAMKKFWGDVDVDIEIKDNKVYVKFPLDAMIKYTIKDGYIWIIMRPNERPTAR